MNHHTHQRIKAEGSIRGHCEVCGQLRERRTTFRKVVERPASMEDHDSLAAQAEEWQKNQRMICKSCEAKGLGEVLPGPTDGSLLKGNTMDLWRESSGLTDRERKLIELRHGLSDGHTRTYGDLGRIFKISATRARQIEIDAVRKMVSRIGSPE